MFGRYSTTIYQSARKCRVHLGAHKRSECTLYFRARLISDEARSVGIAYGLVGSELALDRMDLKTAQRGACVLVLSPQSKDGERGCKMRISWASGSLRSLLGQLSVV